MSQFQQCWKCWFDTAVETRSWIVAGVVELVNVVAVVHRGVLPRTEEAESCKTIDTYGDVEIKEGLTCKDGSKICPALQAVFVCDTAVDTCK